MLCSLTIKGFGILFSNQEFESKHDAQRDFEFQYEDKTGNKWKNRDNFQKVARKFFPPDIDLGGDNDQVQKLSAKDSKSNLPKAVQVTRF